MNHASLFSGIGGFDLAAKWIGWDNIFQVEKDPWCQSILVKHFPNTERYLDIKEFNGEKYRGSVDVISGGFPCQPFSVAGKQKGKTDDRYLWPEMLRVIREIQPTWIVGENVPGIISMALDQVCTDLENEGYTVQAFIIPAASVNAIHKRDRVWILANNANAGLKDMRERAIGSMASNAEHNGRFTTKIGRSSRETIHNPKTRQDKPFHLERNGSVSTSKDNVPHTTSEQGQPDDVRETWETQQIQFGRRNCQKPRLAWPVSQPTICRGDDGISYRLDDGQLITAKQRTNALKGLGNSVVPQVVYEIFRMIGKIK